MRARIRAWTDFRKFVLKSGSEVEEVTSLRELAAEMNRLGFPIDLSHVSDEAFDQALALTVVPPITAHSSGRFFTPGFDRNLDTQRIPAPRSTTWRRASSRWRC